MASLPEDEMTSLKKRFEEVSLNDAEGSPVMTNNIISSPMTAFQIAKERVQQYFTSRFKSVEKQPRTEEISAAPSSEDPDAEDCSATTYVMVHPPSSEFETVQERVQQEADVLVNPEKRLQTKASDEDQAVSHRPTITDSEQGCSDHGQGTSCKEQQIDDHPEQRPSIDVPLAPQYCNVECQTRKIDVPSSKVSLVIGKDQETVKYLQSQSGAKIIVTSDADCDIRAPTRQVELTGNPGEISRAEQLINSVIAAGGLEALVLPWQSVLQPTTEFLRAKERMQQMGAPSIQTEKQPRTEGSNDDHAASLCPSSGPSSADSHDIFSQVQKPHFDDHPQQVLSPDFHSAPQHYNQDYSLFYNQLQIHSQQQSQHYNPGYSQYGSQYYSPGYAQSYNQGYPQVPLYYNHGYSQYYNQGYPQFFNEGHPWYYPRGCTWYYNQGYQTRKIYIPISKIDLVIGKGGDTLMSLRDQSGARIEIGGDVDSDAQAQTKLVWLMGSPDQINRAEQLIKEKTSEQTAAAEEDQGPSSAWFWRTEST